LGRGETLGFRRWIEHLPSGETFMSNVSRRDALKLAATTGLVTLVSGSVRADDKKTDDKWRAWAVTEGEQTQLVVDGIYSHGGPGLVVIVKDAVPQGINPKILLLDLKTATLPGVWPAVLQPVPAYYTKAPYKKDQYESVQIRYPDGTTVVSINKIIDAGKWPR
jgi:hypothetical protein